MVRLNCGRLRVTRRNEDKFHGDMTLARLGSVNTSLITADAHTVARPSGLTCPDESEFVYVCQVLAGSATVTQDDRASAAGTGEMVMFDNTRPFTLSMAARFRMMVLKIPHRALGVAPMATARLTARRLSDTRGVAALLSPLLISLAAHMGELDPASAQQVGCSIAGLITTLFSEHLRRDADDPAAVRQAQLLRVQASARERLRDPQLCPRVLAEKHHISVRHLQKIFQEQGLSPASFIRDERLNRCAADLHDPRLRDVPVALIGERWGLTSASHFSRLFRERFGVTPQEYRRLGRTPERVGRTMPMHEPVGVRAPLIA